MPANSQLRLGRAQSVVTVAAFMLLLSGCSGVLPTDASRSGLKPGGPSLVVNPGEYLNVFVHAHQDDWPLFMGNRASAGLQSTPNIVFIYTTAGDGGLTASFWQTRELAARAAMDLLAGAAGAWTCSSQTINTHPIRKCVKGTAISYELRLPSCAMSGDGYAGRGCIGDLRDGRPTLVALDGSTTYTSWSDLYTTVRGIVDYESNNQSAPLVEVHAPDYDRVANMPNHPDHLSTGDVVQAAAGTRSWNVSWYIDYPTQSRAVNLTQAQHDIKRDVFYAYDNYMGAAGLGRNQWEAEYQAWLWRTYFRTVVSVPAPPPATPANLAAQTISASRVNLTWTTGTTNGTGFAIERAPDVSGVAGAYAQIGSVSISTTSFSSTGLASTTRYWFRVRAFNTVDNSAYSNQTDATTLLAPAAPSGLAGQGISTTRIDLTWTDNASNETAYSVERAPDNAGVAGTFAQVASLPAGSTASSSTGLNANTRYWFRVRAISATDSSAYSAALSVLTLQGPAAPSGLAAQAVSPTQINLTWTDNTTVETGYTVERAPDNAGVAGTFAAIATLPANAVSYSDATANQNTRYWYRVRDFTALDVSAYSAQVSAITPQAPPAAPTNLQAQAMSASTIALTWTDNANNESGFLIDRAPDVAGVAGTFAQIASVGANVTAFTNTLLTPSTRYWYRVRSFNSAQNSAFSTSANTITLAPPAQRTDVYFHAHQDDWMLFQSDRAYGSYQVATKLVIVYTTAGDGGQSTAFWIPREAAAKAGTDVIVGAGAWTCANQTINGHPIRRCTKGKAVTYEMRLPSCAMNEVGYGGRGCILDLRDGNRATLVALDGSTTYTSWTDLYTTARGIVDFEASPNLSAPFVEVHATEYNRAINLPNHPDHLATGDLVHAAALTRTWNTSWYIDYRTQTMAINLNQATHDLKRDIFYAYDNYMGAAGLGRNQYEADYQAWLWRTYFRSGP